MLILILASPFPKICGPAELAVILPCSNFTHPPASVAPNVFGEFEVETTVPVALMDPLVRVTRLPSGPNKLALSDRVSIVPDLIRTFLDASVPNSCELSEAVAKKPLQVKNPPLVTENRVEV